MSFYRFGMPFVGDDEQTDRDQDDLKDQVKTLPVNGIVLGKHKTANQRQATPGNERPPLHTGEMRGQQGDEEPPLPETDQKNTFLICQGGISSEWSVVKMIRTTIKKVEMIHEAEIHPQCAC